MLIAGNSFSDERGVLNFVNDFNFKGVKRFYSITHPDTSVVRAWQGHKIEVKHFFVSRGSFLVAWVKPDNWEAPSSDLIPENQILSASFPAILTVEAGHANGFRALEPDSTLIVFSSLELLESSSDLYRFEKNLWNL